MTTTSSSTRGRRSLQSLPPTETLEIGSGLSLSPRLKLLLTFVRCDPAVKPIDEWQLKLSLLEFLRSTPLSLSIPEDDLQVNKRPDLHKRKREDPVASGTLYIRDLGFLKGKGRRSGEQKDEEDVEVQWKRFLDWRKLVMDRLGGIELNIEGVKFRMSVEIPFMDDFENMKRSWEESYEKQLLGNRNSLRGMARRADTVIIQGLPSRWFAEPRVSSKPSMLVTHTIFSVLGKIRNLNVAADDDLGKKAEEIKGGIVSGLQCKVWVQFDNHDEFCNAMKVLCGRSIQKEGSRLKVDYEIAWDKDGFFQNMQHRPARSHVQERDNKLAGALKHDGPRHQSHVIHLSSDGPRQKRFRD